LRQGKKADAEGKGASRAKDAGQGPRMDATGTVYEAIKTALPEATGPWEDVLCTTPDGGEVIWQRVRATGEQEFYYVTSGGEGPFVKAPGLLELYARTEEDFLVIVAWRMPASIKESSRLDALAPAVPGTIKFVPR